MFWDALPVHVVAHEDNAWTRGNLTSVLHPDLLATLPKWNLGVHPPSHPPAPSCCRWTAPKRALRRWPSYRREAGRYLQGRTPLLRLYTFRRQARSDTSL